MPKSQSSDPKYKCVAVRSPLGARQTVIEWGDGHRGLYPHSILRGYCPCAGCQGHETPVQFLEPTDYQMEIDTIHTVGNYALCIKWFDGHDSGIYSYRYLRSLCFCERCAPGQKKPNQGDAAPSA